MIGKKIRGFSFNTNDTCRYWKSLDVNIDKIGTIKEETINNYYIDFGDWSGYYPKDLCLQHLVEEDSVFFKTTSTAKVEIPTQNNTIPYKVDDNSKLLVTSASYRELLGFEVPTHYQTGKEFDVIDFCKMYNLNFNLGNVVKYCARAGKKDDIIKDLKKALDYLQREIKHLEL